MYYFRSQVHADPFCLLESNFSPPPQLPTTTTAAMETTINHHHQRCHSTSILGRTLNTILKRFHAGYFRITLSLGSQALLWKSLIEPTTTMNNPFIHHIFHRLHPVTSTSIWWLAFIILSLFSVIYLLRLTFHLDLVKAEEFHHHIRVNYIFAPWISWLLLLQSAPINIQGAQPGDAPYLGLWWALVVPVVALDLKIYGQWFTTKGQKYNLTAVANPASQMTVVANLVGSRAAALMGWNETAMVLFSLGMVHYLVLFVTLYQRLSGRNTLPDVLRPVFSLFFAVPVTASLAWAAISGRFDTAAKMLFFLSLFLFMSLACRPGQFKRAMKKYNVTWWAYSFPITVVAIGATEYAAEVQAKPADILMLGLLALSMTVTFLLLLFTFFSIFSPLPTTKTTHSPESSPSIN